MRRKFPHASERLCKRGFAREGFRSRERENNENEDGGEEKEEDGKRMVEEEEEKRTELCRFVGYSRDVIRCCFYRP